MISSHNNPVKGVLLLIPTLQMEKMRYEEVYRFASWPWTDLNQPTLLPTLRKTHSLSGYGHAHPEDSEVRRLDSTSSGGITDSALRGSGKSSGSLVLSFSVCQVGQLVAPTSPVCRTVHEMRGVVAPACGPAQGRPPTVAGRPAGGFWIPALVLHPEWLCDLSKAFGTWLPRL